MTSMPHDYVDFASFLHRDKQDPEWALKEEKAGILAMLRKERFVIGLDVRYEAYRYIQRFFESRSSLESTGLRHVFIKIKEDVVKNNTFGFILLGYYHMRDSGDQGKILNKYTTPSNFEITLTVDSVCKAMMEDDEFFKDDEVRIELCKKIPNYKIYIDSVE